MSWLVIAKVTVVLALARLALVFMRGNSAAMRHTVIVIALFAAVLMPVLEVVLPAWEVLPRASLSSATETPGSDMMPPAFKATPATAGKVPVPVSAAAGVAISWQQWLNALWLSGVIALLGLLAVRLAAMSWAVRRARPFSDRSWLAALASERNALGICTPVELRLRSEKSMPAVWGVRSAVILLPEDCRNWSASRRRDVLAHELAHVVRRDVLLLTFGHIACALHWFNPLVWMLKHRLAVECEHACDDLALSEKTTAPRYADHLLATAVKYTAQHSLAPVMAARSLLEGRIMAILDPDRNRKQASRRAQLVIAALAAIALVPLSSITWAQAKDMWAGAATHVQGHAHSDSTSFADHLEELGIEKSDTNALLAGLNAKSALTRGASAWALGESDDETVIDPLIQAGYDTDAVVRQWAVRSLAAWDAPRIAELLVARLRDNDAEVRQWAARTLQRHDDAARTQPLIDTLGDNNAEVREWAVRVLAESDDPRVLPALANRVAAESDANVSEWIVRALGNPAEARSVEVLLAALYNDSSAVRQWAVRGLAGVRDERITDALIGMLSDEDDEVREWSARGLGFCGNGRAVGPLQAMSQDSSDDVREWVGRALEEIDC